jgi:hypothetical protein
MCSSLTNTAVIVVYCIIYTPETLGKWFPNFFGSRTTCKNLVVREGQNIDLYWDSRTTSANLANHQRSAEQTSGTTAQGSQYRYSADNETTLGDSLSEKKLSILVPTTKHPRYRYLILTNDVLMTRP